MNEYISDIRRHAIRSAQHLSNYNCPHKLLTTTSQTNLEHWLLLMIFELSFFQIMT